LTTQIYNVFWSVIVFPIMTLVHIASIPFQGLLGLFR
jgi:hypothetical protein